MKVRGIAIVDVEPMRDDPPPSDALIALRLAKWQEKFHDNGGTTEWRKLVAVAAMQRILHEHDMHQAAFANWIAAGRPPLDKEPKA